MTVPTRDDRALAHAAFAALAAYLVFHVALRVYLSDSVELDEAEQILATQELRLIYGVQPPLYTWLQALGFRLLGLDVLALSLVKHVILGLTYVFVYLTATTITGERRCGVFAMLSLLLIPQFSVESHRTLTHSVLATAAAAGATLAFVRLLAAPAAGRYAVLGLALGAGVLSKYNFVVFGLALLASGLCLRRFRGAVLDRRLLLTLLATVVVVGPHLYAVVNRPELAAAETGQLEIDAVPTHLAGLIQGGGDVVLSLAWLLAALGAVYLALFVRSRPRGAPDPAVRDGARLIALTFLIAAGVVLAAAVAFRMAEVKDRWFQPLLVLPPIYVAARLRERIDGRRLAWLAICAGLAVSLSVGWLYLRGTRPDVIGRYVRLHLPMRELADAARARGFDGGVIAGELREYAGGLRLQFRDSVAIAPRLAGVDLPDGVPWLVAWKAGGDLRAPDELARLVQERRGVALRELAPTRFEALYRHAAEDTIAFAFVIIAP